MTRTHPATREMTVSDLIRFTSGLGGRNSRIYRDHDVRSHEISLQQFIENVAGMPLFEEPRSRWRYGISTTVLGRIVEVVSGQALDEFLEQRVFEPLGMRDAGFWVPRVARRRLATVYRPSDEGGLRPVQLESVPFTERPALIEGGIGLLSSTVDFLRFSQMCFNGGELDSVRLVTPETIALMATNQVPDAPLPLGFGRPMLGTGWGLGFSIVMDRSEYAYPVSNGEYWWDGSAGTRFWIDPAEDMVTIVMAQNSPARGNGFREEFKTLVYDALVD